MGWISGLLLLTFIFMGLPVAFALAVAAAVFMWWSGVPQQVFVQRLVLGVDSFPLLAIPFFILAGNLMSSGGITVRIFRLAHALVGHIRGGMGHVSVVANMIMAGMSGSAIADAAGLGPLAIESMRRSGYPKDLAAAIMAAGATIGPIIPPSIIMVIYATSAGGVSVAKLFLGGIGVGVLMGLSLMMIVWFKARQMAVPSPWTGWRDLAVAFKEAILATITPVLIIGGILSGVFTPTESAAVAAFYAMLLGAFVYRELTLKKLLEVLSESMLTTSVVFTIMAATSAFGWILAFARVPQAIAETLSALTSSPLLMLVLLMAIYFYLGTIMEAVAIVIVTVPIVMPVLEKLSIDPVHFGVLLAVNVSIGTLTPPVGLVMFVICGIAKLSIEEFTRAAWPFIAALVACLALAMVFPETVLLIPRLVLGR
ncbi:MAG: TRAP transporter large permease [Candidatus Rokubacteria bacterium]|nr:TRAP transporter large permease [Candidatus Rokubacteria bacterium]